MTKLLFTLQLFCFLHILISSAGQNNIDSVGIGENIRMQHPDGPWKYEANGFIWLTGFYSNNQKTGEWTLYDGKGHMSFIGNYENGLMHGKWKYFYPNGNIMSTSFFKNGVKHGMMVSYYENEMTHRICYYKDGKLDSVETVYSADGKICKRIIYKSGLPSDTSENISAKYNCNNDELGFVVEAMPAFPGGEKELMAFLKNNLNYPVESGKNNVAGKVVAQFGINQAGDLYGIEIVQSVNQACDDEVIRVLRSMPNWVPAFQNGEPVNLTIKLPIAFD